MPSIEKEPIYDVYCISRHQYQRFLNILFGDSSVAQIVALMSRVVLGDVAEVVGSNLARGKIFTASISSVDSLYPSVLIYCLNLHQFLILCSLKAMMSGLQIRVRIGKLVSLFLIQNICCGYSKEPSQ